MDINKYKVKARDLRKQCNPSVFKFVSTAEIKPLKGIIGQDRAVNSLSFGLDIENMGYNIYLAGAFGTGKTTLAHEMLDNKARQMPVPPDWVYVYNFQNPDSPRALKIPAGNGAAFKKDVSEQVDKVIEQIVKFFESEDFEYKKNKLLSAFIEETNLMYIQIDEEARTLGFTISRNQSGVNSVPLKEDGETLSQDEYMAMSENERTELMKKGSIVQEKLSNVLRQYKELERNVRIQITELEQETAREAAAPFFDELTKKYHSLHEVEEYLKAMQDDLLENIDDFVKADDESTPYNVFRHMHKRALFRKYQVNLIVDNSDLKHAPVIFETNPTFANLFGQIEYEGEFGILATDFSKIKAGSVHKANGGYLVLHVYDVINNFYIWDTLKRILKNGEIRIESISRMIGISSAESLRPEPISSNLKVILIGESVYYYLLYRYDEEFQKLFKIRADFDTDMQKSRRHIKEYARFISSVCENEKLRHFSPDAVAAVVDYGSRMAEDKEKLTTLFNKLIEIIYESNCWAQYDKAEIVNAGHVKKAIVEKRYRSSMIEDKLQDYINRETLIIDVTSAKIGEINGLAVYEMGDYQFGKPVRITAKTFMGEKGLVNIEREIRLSGSIHSKGVLTLNGYLGAQYARDKRLSLSASLTFEQSYQGIEGDSASSAELYAILSSLAEIPLKQGIAVTGSVNQNGEIQPVGGVNQKIEGFFRVCQDKGIDGKQGVIIPQQNIRDLMLDDEIVAAVKNKTFSIWAIKHVDEGLEILSGIQAGKRGESGTFTPGSFHYLADNRLREWSAKRKADAQRLSRHENRRVNRRRRRY
ncbi:MAG: ATP-binding protein [Syntrophomonadaceae bacterium]|nr:ATP-binding protein [Syntrophomonadaceae bacterium]MDD3889003.1 ATP-binding protein [Syntrophomonadaceae bacterium]MDD4548298.1 ATP-binding protein [Syntrophomonadaceae bacterium]